MNSEHDPREVTAAAVLVALYVVIVFGSAAYGALEFLKRVLSFAGEP